MIKDQQELLSDGQTGITATAASTNVYDAGFRGDAIGSHLWIFVRVATKLDSASHTATVQAVLETADDAAFSVNKTTLIAGAAIVVTALPAGTVLMKALIPIGMRQFLRVNYVVATENLNAGAVDAMLVSDIDDILNY